MPRYFRARHAFERDPSEDGEMSVSAGELLMYLEDRAEADGDGWTLVQSLVTGESGFVPTEWLVLLTPEEEEQLLTVGTTALRAVATLPGLPPSVEQQTQSSRPTSSDPAVPPSAQTACQTSASRTSATVAPSATPPAPAPAPSTAPAPSSVAFPTSSSFLYTNPRFTTMAAEPPQPPPPPPPPPSTLAAPLPPKPLPPASFAAHNKDEEACCGGSMVPLSAALQRLVSVTAASSLERPPALRAAVAAEDYDEVYRRSDGFFRDLRAHYHESSATLTSTVDAMAARIAHGADDLGRFNQKVGALKELLDEERRKWKQQHEGAVAAGDMNNKDFAKLVVSGGGGEGGGGDGGGGGGGGKKVDRAGLLKAISQQYRVKKQQQHDEDEDDDDEEGVGNASSRDKYDKMRKQEEEVKGGKGKGKGPKKDGEGGYRDRAEERRKGHNPDYDDEIAKLVDMDAEKTKYLGGDLKHTHLVKGLDYALLTKVRTELAEKEQKEGEEEAAKQEGGEGDDGRKADKDRKKKSMEAVSTRTMLGKSIKFFLAQTYSTAIRPIDIFRTSALEYFLDPDDKAEVLPTLINRSKAEMELEEESGPVKLYTLPDLLQARITRAAETFRQNAAGLKKRLKKRQRSEREYVDSSTTAPTSHQPPSQQQPRGGAAAVKGPTSKAPMVLVDDEDIFADVGKYVPAEVAQDTTTKPPPEKKKAEGAADGAKDYFSGLRAARDDEEAGEKEKGAKLDDVVKAIHRKAGLGKDEEEEEEGEEEGVAGGGEEGGGQGLTRRQKREKKRKATVGGIDLFDVGGGGRGGGGPNKKKAAPGGFGLGGGGADYGEEYFPDAGFAGYDSDEERGRVGTNRTKQEKAAEAARARKERERAERNK